MNRYDQVIAELNRARDQLSAASLTSSQAEMDYAENKFTFIAVRRHVQPACPAQPARPIRVCLKLKWLVYSQLISNALRLRLTLSWQTLKLTSSALTSHLQ